MLKIIVPVLILCLSLSACQSQTNSKQIISQDFDKSIPFDYKMPRTITAIDSSPGWKKNADKILLTGTVYEANSTKPAKNVLLYYYQTDENGIYKTDANEPRNMPKNDLGQTHGFIRGWVKTDSLGHYSIYTIKPGSYPSRGEPAHIHMNVKEPKHPSIYYIDDFVFDSDRLLTTKKRLELENRGGSGILRLVNKDGLWIGERDIYLGMNIPEYPKKTEIPISGKMVGEEVHSFTPKHAYGLDKGSSACPVCKYGWYQGILYFVGNNPNWKNINKWLSFLDEESVKRDNYLKVYFVYGNDTPNDNDTFRILESLGEELKLKRLALTYVPSFTDEASMIHLNRVNQDVSNTFIIYQRSKIIGNFNSLLPNAENFKLLQTLLDKHQNAYFKLSSGSNAH